MIDHLAVWARGPLGFSVGEWLGIFGATLLACVLVAVPVLWWRDRRKTKRKTKRHKDNHG